MVFPEIYYRNNPEWHLFARAGVHSHQALVAAQDRLLEGHPNLRVIGAHLGALEFDVAQVTQRLRRFPNYAVDMSARLRDLIMQDAPKVRAFFAEFPDRILYGTDLAQQHPHSRLSPSELEGAHKYLRAESQAHFRYFEGSGPLELDGWKGDALALGPDVLRKFYVDNARAWYPGL